MAFWLIFIGGLILTVGDVFQKQWVATGKTYNFWIGLLIWLIGCVCLAFSFKEKNMAVASVMFVVFNALSLSLVSWFWYNEKLTATQMTAMALAVASIVVLEFK